MHSIAVIAVYQGCSSPIKPAASAADPGQRNIHPDFIQPIGFWSQSLQLRPRLPSCTGQSWQ